VRLFDAAGEVVGRHRDERPRPAALEHLAQQRSGVVAGEADRRLVRGALQAGLLARRVGHRVAVGVLARQVQPHPRRLHLADRRVNRLLHVHQRPQLRLRHLFDGVIPQVGEPRGQQRLHEGPLLRLVFERLGVVRLLDVDAGGHRLDALHRLAQVLDGVAHVAEGPAELPPEPQVDDQDEQHEREEDGGEDLEEEHHDVAPRPGAAILTRRFGRQKKTPRPAGRCNRHGLGMAAASTPSAASPSGC
jgi:hypothetical protein